MNASHRLLPANYDLVSLDPPCNSNRDYNVIFRDESGNTTDAQLLAYATKMHSLHLVGGRSI